MRLSVRLSMVIGLNAFICVVAAADGKRGPPDLATMCAEYRRSLNAYDQCEFVATLKVRSTASGPAHYPKGVGVVDANGLQVFRFLVRLDFPRVDIVRMRDTNTVEQVKADPNASAGRDIVVGEEWLQINAPADYLRGNAIKQSSKSLDQPAHDLRVTALSNSLGEGKILDGWVNLKGYRSIPDLFSESASTIVDANPVLIGSSETWLVRYDRDEHHLKAWLDPDLGYQPRRVVYERSGKGPDVAIEVDGIEYERIDGHPISTSATITQDFQSDHSHAVIQYRRDGVRLAPSDLGLAFKLQTPPSSYAVINFDSPGLDWKVEGGKFVQAVDPDVVQSVDDLLKRKAERKKQSQPATDGSANTAPRTPDLSPAVSPPVAVATESAVWPIYGVVLGLLCVVGTAVALWVRGRRRRSAL